MSRLNGNYHYLYLIVIALMSWWLVKLTGSTEPGRVSVPPHSRDYFSTGYTKWEMSELGRPKNKLIADQMTHYSDDRTTHLVNPLMHFYNDRTPPWVIKSETGILSADGNDLLLNGKVYVDRASAPGVRELKIHTSNLRVKPATSYAETDEWAELISLPNWTTGKGMKVVFSEPIHLELLSNVKGNYETKK